MFWLYSRKTEDAGTRYFNRVHAHLFGSKAGWIPKLLAKQLLPSHGEPYAWHVSVRDALAKTDHPNASLVIDVKPKNRKQPVLSFFELHDVCGYSQYGWSPALFRLREILRKENLGIVDPKDFLANDSEYKKPVYTFLYFKGTVSNGRLDGSWIPPKVSAANSVLLWPEALQYFFKCIQQLTPDVLGAGEVMPQTSNPIGAST